MRQFLAIKESHPDGILFFRMGDFYEMFFEDAVIAARALELTLTSRDKGKADAIPMAGIPHHAARGYLARLTELGHKVVICEQVEDPKQAKGLVKREVVQIVTPGVVTDGELLEPKESRYLAAVVAGERGRFGLAHLDVSTGEFRATEVDGDGALHGEVSRVRPREILVSRREGGGGALAAFQKRYRDAAYTVVPELAEEELERLIGSALGAAPADLGLDAAPLAARAAAEVIAYARAAQPGRTLPVVRLQLYSEGDAVVLDDVAIANLELVQTLGGKKDGSLLSILDATRTGPGGRLLRRWLLYPLKDIAAIRRRHDAVEYLVGSASLRGSLRDLLKGMYDLERLAGRISLGTATPRDLGQLRRALELLPEVAALAAGRGAKSESSEAPELLAADSAILCELEALRQRLASTLADELPTSRREGGIVRAGVCERVDEHRSLADGGKERIGVIESRERQRTGISSLKVKYNRVFGYYIEVSRSQVERVPDDYIRKQTIATAERYVTPELAELEARILGAEELLIEREAELFADLCAEAAGATVALLRAGQWLAVVDCCAALAETAHRGGYVRPEVLEGEVLDIREGRHPVVEEMVAAGTFVPNDCRLDPAREQLLLITGPNMAGKSTYMRQVAHIVLLAQMGSFVPARAASIGVVDRIFTRVGASDNLAQGESTFMVEMRETATILKGATRRSLVLLDEVGRGTSTFDGVSIAWAVSEYLHDAIGAKTLFATHYHELTALAESRPRVKNASMAVREHEGQIVFLRQVVPLRGQ